MKVLNLIIAIYFIYYINCQTVTDWTDYCGYANSPKSANDCKNRKVEEDGGKCCYVYYSKLEEKGHCYEYDKYKAANIPKLIKINELEEEIYEDHPDYEKTKNERGDYHIDCFSEYIKISLISILLILF